MLSSPRNNSVRFRSAKLLKYVIVPLSVLKGFQISIQ
nr:MAG TPA: hypothetical protein [Caudoviricetes sp.]